MTFYSLSHCILWQLLETFYRAVLCSQDESDMDDLLVLQLAAFLVDHYVAIFTVPQDLKATVEACIAKLQRKKVTLTPCRLPGPLPGLRY